MNAIIDLHCHTIASGHAYSTLKENIDEAKLKGLKYVGVSDHAPNMPGSTHPFYFGNLGVIKEEINGVKVLKGIEANIMDFDGNIDIPSDVVGKLDYVIASFHPPCINPGNIHENTKAILNVMENKEVKIIGHLDDSRYPVDYEKVVVKAKETNTLLEINNSSLRTNSFRVGAIENAKVLLNLCKKHDVKVVLGSDAHIYYQVGNFENCTKILEEVNFPGNLVVNFNEEYIKEYFFGK
ncbi:phosphatase [Paraclostridium bifermentans]|uniref:phosphatase n=1 Tax=Paraclostridium bifermentans TaxID=1490 RepID=UPI00038D1C67|nr:phosphatase [Paraclostridium bifermentans]MDV8116050.1 phosphatase [Bacillus sp. BAU-SS-2023]EQK47888.1 PHP domain protein [[Clostridium] bifermentans ATCC 19299] [Paraclostridium bifermentans ATCC 19299]MCE9677239.1 phosphatase [Paraclostridium bifermentans]TQO56008.1 phosphatase [Paraclostridium bifermentans]UOW68338.1 phosphatase [Paraclostridium bifermentans]